MATSKQQVESALGGLSSADRALLALSFQRGMGDTDVGGLLRSEPEEVARRRAAALDQLAAAVAPDAADGREQVSAALRETKTETPAAPKKAAPKKPAPPKAARPKAAPARRKAPPARRTPTPRVRPRGVRALGGLVVGLLGLVALAVAVVVAGSTDEGPSGSSDSGSDSLPEASGSPPEVVAGNEIELQSLPTKAVEGEVVASVTDRDGGQVLTMRLRGLREPQGRYSVWLFNSLIDSERLGTTDSGTGVIRAELPPDAGSFRSIDLSRQPLGRKAHSGVSVFRVPLDQLDAAPGGDDPG